MRSKAVRIRRSRKQGIARLEIPVSTAQAKHRIRRLPAEAVKLGRIPICLLFRAGDGDFQPLENELPRMEHFQASPVSISAGRANFRAG
jgi:hypothetical protein